MTRRDAGKLLGGHATGILTDAERRALYQAALEDQALFDALADEEALRELLADPAARAQLLAALAPAPVIPFWRRPGVLGVAATLLVAGLASLVVWRSPRPVFQEAAPAPLSVPFQEAPKAVVAPEPRPKAPAPPRSRQAPKVAPVPAPMGGPPAAPPPPAAQALEERIPSAPAAGVAANLAPGVVADAARAGGAPAAKAEKKAKAAPRSEAAAVVEVVASEAPPPLEPAPTWTLEPQPDGTLRITVLAPKGLRVLLLERQEGAVTVVRGLEAGWEASRLRWRIVTHPAPGAVLDLYGLAKPVADPATLPPGTPEGGFWARLPQAGGVPSP